MIKNKRVIITRLHLESWRKFKAIAKKRGMTCIDLFDALIHGIDRTEIKK